MADNWECILQAFVAIVQLTGRALSSVTARIGDNYQEWLMSGNVCCRHSTQLRHLLL